ncbi:MAG: ferredoxin [Actinomycetota bacterium]
MRIQVDAERCQGHNRCFGISPELFDVDDDGFASVLGDGEVPPGLEDKAEMAILNCPEFAISKIEEAAS